MTTSAEVKRWTKSILAEHDDLTLEGRDLYVRPIRHIYRAIRFLGSSNKSFPTPTASFGLLCGPPSGPFGNGLGMDLLVGYSTDTDFQRKLEQEVRQVLTASLRRLTSLQTLYDLTLEHHTVWRGSTKLSFYPVAQAVVLAATGKLPDACGVIDAHVSWIDETSVRARLAEAERLLIKRPKCRIAKIDIRSANYRLLLLDDLKRLRELTGAGDRAAIGALLRGWEHDRVRELGIEHLWEPTPFPVELG